MGDIVHFSCDCGYSKELFLGGGMMSCNRMQISRFFPQEMSEFIKEYENGEIGSYCMETELAICKNCNELEAVEVFRYTNKKGLQEFYKECKCCNNKVQIIKEDNVVCPKCEAILKKQIVGHWD